VERERDGQVEKEVLYGRILRRMECEHTIGLCYLERLTETLVQRFVDYNA